MRARGQWVTTRRIETQVQAARDRAVLSRLRFHCRVM